MSELPSPHTLNYCTCLTSGSYFWKAPPVALQPGKEDEGRCKMAEGILVDER